MDQSTNISDSRTHFWRISLPGQSAHLFHFLPRLSTLMCSMYLFLYIQLAQAGVSLGLASEVAVKFPGWGPKFQTMIISVVLINQFAGPVACKWALRRHGEAGKMAEGEDMHGHGGGHGESSEDSKKPLTVSRSIIIGVDPIALSVASRLLKENWRVTLLDYKSSNLKLAKALKVKKVNK